METSYSPFLLRLSLTLYLLIAFSAVGRAATVAAPVFTPYGGIYNPFNPGQTATLSTTTTGASIRYTTDGSTPSDTAELSTPPRSRSTAPLRSALSPTPAASPTAQ